MDTIYYEQKTVVRMRDCDRFRRLKPAAVLALFQDCSEDLTEGWGVGLDAMLGRGIIWVAAKVECSVARLPLHGETITVRGWAGRSRSGICPFHYEIGDEAGQTLVTGCSFWVLSDLQTHSMMSPNIPKISLPTPEPEGTHLPRLRPIHPPAAYETAQRQVLYSETDINGHLTNTRYVDWICDLAADDFHRSHPMTGLRINYRAETFPGQTVDLHWSLDDTRLWCASPGRFEAEITF
jgi:acyl-ACP thioesterase